MATDVDFVEVLDEPCHKPVIRNSCVNVYVAKLARSHQTIYHRHKENTVYIVIAGSQCTHQFLGSDSTLREYRAGDCFAAEHRLKPIIHRLQCLNESSSDAWFVGSEILQNKPFLSDHIFQHHRYEHIPKINILGCRAYRLKLDSNQTTGHHLFNFSGVFISLTNGQLEINENFPLPSGTVEPGHVTYFEGPIGLEMKNIGPAIYQAILLELASN